MSENRIKRYFHACPKRAILFFLIGMLSQWGMHRVLYHQESKVLREKHEGQYEFINPLLGCEGNEDIISWELRPFKNKIEALVNKRVEDKKVSGASVYFRDLNDGPWFGLNENRPFIPASLLKVPIMIDYLKMAETNPGILETKIMFDLAKNHMPQFFPPPNAMEQGKSYTIDELLFRMIVYSDNDAAHLLLTFDKEHTVDIIYKELDIPSPSDFGSSYKLDVAQYSSFFRVLFNASLLNKDMSNMALQLLSNVDFPGGIRSGVPAQIPVAQKFGEREIGNGLVQLHDCGIVYYPRYPYLLCIMTEGEDIQRLDFAIRDISQATFEEVDRQMKSNKFRNRS